MSSPLSIILENVCGPYVTITNFTIISVERDSPEEGMITLITLAGTQIVVDQAVYDRVQAAGYGYSEEVEARELVEEE